MCKLDGPLAHNTTHRCICAFSQNIVQRWFKELQRISHLRNGAEAEDFGVLDLPHVGKAIWHQREGVRYELVQTPQGVISARKTSEWIRRAREGREQQGLDAPARLGHAHRSMQHWSSADKGVTINNEGIQYGDVWVFVILVPSSPIKATRTSR